MKFKMFIFFQVLVSTVLFGCYQMDKKEQLNILVVDSRVNHDDLIYYVDSILNKDLAIPDSIKGIVYGYDNLQKFERVIHFDKEPNEYFLINFFGNPIVIESVFNKDLSNYAIYRRDDLSEEQIERIKRRFKVELLDKVVFFEKNKPLLRDSNKIPDVLNSAKNTGKK